jgi:diguanylate cyclase (GGDEF)-like protein
MAWDGSEFDGRHAELAERWAAALGGGARDHAVPMSAAEVRELLSRLATQLEEAARAGCTVRAATAGTELARARFLGDEVLGRSIAVLSAHFTQSAQFTQSHGTGHAVLMGAFASGYLRASRTQHDPLTGLAGRSRFFDALGAAFAEPPAHIGLCYVDLDHFKSVNDSFGHAAGDTLLIQAAGRLQACVSRPDQLVARIGGDEFVVLVPQLRDAGEPAALARTVVDAFATPFDVHGRRLTVTASVGVITEHTDRTTADELLQAADSTMYWAKTAGRGRYAVFDPDRRRREHFRAELSAAMPAALARGEFFLDYQPIVDLADGRPAAVEALVRWRHPELGVLNPARFVELAEDGGHIAALGAVVLEQACRDARRWHDRFGAGTPVVSVNVSAVEVTDPVWLERVQHTIADTGIDPGRLQLELTERAFMHATGRPLQALHVLAEAGVRIAIDDFGTGYSNLAYLGRLPLHVVKLAGPFVHRIRTAGDAGRSDLLVLETIIDLGHALGLTVTAECVETRHQAELLLDLGCDTAQGWHFHHPMPMEKVTELLAGSPDGSESGWAARRHPAIRERR